jgi:Trans-aconitate methyltransferase
MPDHHVEKNIEFYSSLLDKHGLNPQSLNWGSQQSQETRFKILAGIAELKNQSILDVGCGLGDFYNWLKVEEKDTVYHGIDITPKMIETASARFPGVRFDIGTVEDIVEDESYDFVFASGIFYLVENEPYSFMKKTILKMLSISKKGIAFNSLSAWADSKTKGEFYASPGETLEYCKTLSPYVVLRHDYHPADFTVYIYKNRINANL